MDKSVGYFYATFDYWTEVSILGNGFNLFWYQSSDSSKACTHCGFPFFVILLKNQWSRNPTLLCCWLCLFLNVFKWPLTLRTSAKESQKTFTSDLQASIGWSVTQLCLIGLVGILTWDFWLIMEFYYFHITSRLDNVF
jgi:hypothetical protein